MGSLPYFILSGIVTIGVFTYLFRHISIGEVLALVQDSYLPALLLFLALSLVAALMRTWRYALILHVAGYRPGFFALFLVVLVRNLFADLLPARIGSLIYLYLLNTRLNIPLSGATSSFTLAFAFDLVAMAILILLAGLAAAGNTLISSTTLIIGSCCIGVVSIALVLYLSEVFTLLSRLLSNFAKSRNNTLAARTSKILLDVKTELDNTGTFIIRSKLLVLSLMVRALKYGSLYVLLYALLAPRGYTLETLHPIKIFVGIAVSEAAASLPISGIAGFGAYEGVWVLVFKLLDFPTNLAILTSVSHHLFTQVYGYTLGAVALLLLVFPIKYRAKMQKNSLGSL